MIQIRVWDWPTRLFHWILAGLIIALVITGNVGGNAMVWHFRCGYGVLSLLIFRIMWGFCGGHWSLWRQLTCTPSLVRQYLTPSASHTSSHTSFLGHNPLGSLSIIAILGLLGLQATTGLFSDDEIANSGPLVRFVAESTVSLATRWHKGYGKTLILLLVAIHLLAILWYFIRKKENLTRAMLTGNKTAESTAPSSKDGPATWLLALACMLVSGGLVFALINLGAWPI
jgi:cytochrome b